MSTKTPINRRPLNSRSNSSAQKLAAWLSQKNISPNHISLLSIVFAIISAASIYLAGRGSPPTALYWFIAAVGIQFRLLCNMIDGMVAIEGGKSTPTGDIYNELPDRIADILLLVAAAYSFGNDVHVALGWFCATLAIFTAYARMHSATLTGKHNFDGIMAKPYRMFTLTITCLTLCFYPQPIIMTIALSIIAAGCIQTIARRTHQAAQTLKQSHSNDA